MLFLRDLNPGEMIALTTAWTGELQPIFVSIPEIAGLLPTIVKDHAALVAVGSSTAAEADLAALQATATGLDGRHDHLVRGFQLILLGAIDVLLGIAQPDPALAEQVEDAVDKLLPSGLEAITASYSAEAGNAQKMVQLADKDHAGVLATIPVVKGMNALDLVHAIGEVGAELGAAEQKKAVAAATLKQVLVKQSEIRRRQSAWADSVETVLKALSRSEAPADQIAKIREPVLAAVEKARARVLAERAAKKKAAKEAEAAEKAAAEKAAAEKAKGAAETPAEPKNG